MILYCCACEKDIQARLTDGKEIYGHRPDLYSLPFWKCDSCNNYVGCHHKTKNKTKPLGNIPTKELKNARQYIHRILDPLWKSKRYKRGYIYAKISKILGYEYHTAEIKSLDEARKIYCIVRSIV
jgi:hypothetical protein